MHELVQDYYGRTLQSSADLKTSACCDASALPAALKPGARPHPPRGAGALLRLWPGEPAPARGLPRARPRLRLGARRVCARPARRRARRGGRRGHDPRAARRRAPPRGLPPRDLRLRAQQRALPRGLHRAPRRARPRGRELRRDRLQLRDQPVPGQGRGAARGLSPAQRRVASSTSPTCMPTAACPPRCATIRCCTANAWAARCTGRTSSRWPAPPASPTRAWSRTARSR